MTRLRVLVVEDDPAALAYMGTLIGSWGYDVVEARTAAAALDETFRLCPHVIVSDLIMPGMDGTELIRQLKASPNCLHCERGGRGGSCPFPFFVIVSGQADVSSAVRAVTEGANEVLLKPVDELKLLSILQRYEAEHVVV